MGEADNAPQLAFDTMIGAEKFALAISAYTRSQLMRHVDPALWSKIKVVHCGLPETAFSAPGAGDARVLLHWAVEWREEASGAS